MCSLNTPELNSGAVLNHTLQGRFPEPMPGWTATAYPNPFEDRLSVKLRGIEGTASVSLLNADGIEIASYTATANKPLIIERKLAAGLYFVKVNSSKGESVVKVIKQ